METGKRSYPMPEETCNVLEEPKIADISYGTRQRYANIMLDSAFKLVFGSKANKALLVELLETLIPGKKIADVTFQDKEIPGYFIGDKKTVFDLYCKTDRKETFIVEMQLHEQKFFADRALFYATYPIREQIVTPLEEERIRKMRENGEPGWDKVVKRRNYRLRPVYFVGILNFKLPHVNPSELREGLVSSYSYRSDGPSGELMTDAEHHVFLELPRLKVARDHPERCRTMLERMAFAFRHISFLRERPESFAEEFFIHLFHAAEVAEMTSEERTKYDFDMTTQIDLRAQYDFVLEKGMAKGLRKGRKEGRAEGKNEERIEIARRMLARKVDLDVIADATTLTIDEIQALKR